MKSENVSSGVILSGELIIVGILSAFPAIAEISQENGQN
jgi:hypothetical protein